MQWLMLPNKENPEDFVVSTGKQYSVRDFVNIASELGINIHWKGSGLDEKGFDDDGKLIVVIDPVYYKLLK